MNALTSQTILIYDVVKDTELWYIYWFEDADILGVTDFGRQLYALQLDKDGRKKFMGNMTEKMLKPQWDKIFIERKFKIIKIDHESVQLMFAPKRELELQRIKDENERITAIQKCIQAYIKINCSLPKQNPTETGQNKRVAPNEENEFVENEKQVQPRKARRIPGQIQQAPITFDDDPSETDKMPDSNGKNISPMKS